MKVTNLYRERPLCAKVGDDHDEVTFDARADEAVDVVVPQLAHQLHLLHHVAGNVLLAVKVELLDADDRAPGT